MEIHMKKAAGGDAEAFIWLMEENKHMLYKIARGYLRREEDIADAMQETMLAAFEHIGEVKKAAYFRTWLTRILINKCMDILRKEKRFTDLREFPEQTYTNKEFHHLEFCQTLDMLPEESRIIFLLYYGERFTTREIADTLEINENTVKARLRRGRKYLAKKLGYKSGEV